MNKAIRATALMLLLALIFSTAAVAAPTAVQGVRFARSIADTSLRPAPDALESTAEVSNGQIVRVLSAEGSWVLVSCGGTTGYALTAHFELLYDGDYSLGVGYVCTDGADVLDNPWAGNEIIARPGLGTGLAVTGTYGGWFQLGSADGSVVGYIDADSVVLRDYPRGAQDMDFVEQNTCEAAYIGQKQALRDLAQALVADAMSLQGCSYKWGAVGPDSFDCSGFVNYIYGLYGYEMQRVACDIYRSSGRLIESTDELEPGDILCFSELRNSSYVTHVGIYIGDGSFVHASSGRGEVIISTLDNEYYAEHLVGAKRLLAL